MSYLFNYYGENHIIEYFNENNLIKFIFNKDLFNKLLNSDSKNFTLILKKYIKIKTQYKEKNNPYMIIIETDKKYNDIEIKELLENIIKYINESRNTNIKKK